MVIEQIICILCHNPWQRLHSIPFSSSSSSSLAISISQFGFVPLSLPLANLTCRAEPDLEFEGLLKRQHTRVKYFQGSLMNAMDLERAKVAAAKSSEKKHKNDPHHLRGEYNIFTPAPPCDRLSPACCILSQKAKRLKGTSTKLNIVKINKKINKKNSYFRETEIDNQEIFGLKIKF